MTKQYFPKVTTIAGVAAYAHLAKPDTGGQYSDNKYKVDLVLDPSDDAYEPFYNRLIEAANEAAQMEWGRIPKNLKICLTDGDEKTDKEGNPKEEFAGKMILRAKTQYAPKQVDSKRNPLAEGESASSGDLIKIQVQLFPCSPSGVKQIAARLQAVQLLDKRNSGFGGNIEDAFEEEDGYESEGVTVSSVESTENEPEDF